MSRAALRIGLLKSVAVGFTALAVTAIAVAPQLARPASAREAPKPRIVTKLIPFGPARRAETAAYAQRHYGIHTWRLEHPHVIVEHYTASNSFTSAYSTFESDTPDSELGELPGVCAHFVIDRDGTIYQLVRLNTICRHTVGLNWTAFGIEHVGTSDRQILDSPAQLARVAFADALVDEHVRHPAAERDRPQREPHEPVSPRALPRLALPDPRRLDARRHADLPRSAHAARPPLRRPTRFACAGDDVPLPLTGPVPVPVPVGVCNLSDR